MFWFIELLMTIDLNNTFQIDYARDPTYQPLQK